MKLPRNVFFALFPGECFTICLTMFYGGKTPPAPVCIMSQHYECHINAICRKDRIDRNRTTDIYLRFAVNRRSRYVSTGVNIGGGSDSRIDLSMY